MKNDGNDDDEDDDDHDNNKVSATIENYFLRKKINGIWAKASRNLKYAMVMIKRTKLVKIRC